MTVGKLVLSPTRTYAPVVKAMLDTLPRSSILELGNFLCTAVEGGDVQR